MFLAGSQPVALVLALLSMFCWGTWSNTLVLCGDRLRFESYYVDFTVGVFATALVAALTLGVVGNGCQVDDFGFAAPDCAERARFVPDDLQVHWSKMLLAVAAGSIFNLANMMLTKGIQMVGLALAFPLCIGTALVLGTLLTRLLQGGDSGNDTLLFLGVGIAFIAVCATSLVHKLKDAAAAGQHVSASASKEPGVCAASSSEDDSGEASGEASVEDVHVSVSSASTGWKLGVCIVGGLLMSLWNPLTSMAQKGFGDSSITDADGPGLSPYGSFFFFSVGIVLSSLLLLPLGILFPLDRAPSVPISLVAKDYTSARCSTHLYGLIGGLIWAVGTLSNAVSGQMLSLAASYAIGQSAPMVSIFWGVFLFREFAGAPCLVKGLLVVVVLLYMVSIALIASSRN